MAVARLEIRSRTSYEEGASFAEAGAYERLDGTLHLAVDPTEPPNREIVDLDKAARDEAGLVRFTADFSLLQPVAAGRANRRLLFTVVNRGRRTMPFNGSATGMLTPSERIDPGDGFLLRRGWTLAWSGWQWDVVRGPALMGIEAPQALEDGRPIPGQVVVQFQPNEPIQHHLLADRSHRPYPAADVDDPRAVLSVRDWLDGPRAVIPRDRWRFAHDVDGRPAADDTHVWLADGFQPGRIYELVYRTRICPVVGSGLLAVRDAVSFLRHGGAEDGNPCAGRVDYTFGYGASQSGRFLRHFLYLGLNLDEQARQVFDGLLPSVAGSHRGEFNHRYAQPSVQATRGFGQLPPFAGREQRDPLTGAAGSLLARQRALGGVPRIVYTNTAAEYWPGDCSRGDASLLHTDLGGEHDLEPAPEERIYCFAGTQHGPGTLPLNSVSQTDGSRGLHSFNVVDFSPALRAAFINLERWVRAGEEPPPSAFPRLSDGTATTASQVLERFAAIPGVAIPDPALLPPSRRIDLGPEAGQGVGRYPAVLGEPFPVYVSAVDGDGNEVAGIRLPAVSVPAATYTAWNPRHPDTGGPGQIVMMLGSTLPFPATAEKRQRTGDPRPALAERYRDADDYLAQARTAARRLADQHYLLPEDAELAAQQALQRYLAFSAVPQAQTAPA